MTFSGLKRHVDRLAPAVLLTCMVGLVLGFATVGLGA